ncbi:MAG TPA: GAF domain-containing protein, partial [Stellaceae bacterium]|nr:GAF domain-containing protein [Stellaceae bacterium]
TPLRQGGMGSDAPLVRPLLAGEPFVHIIDLRLVDHPLAQAAVAAGVRTLLSAPLRKGGTLIGMINAARFEVHPFSEKQIALLQNFAAQAVIAIENARLLTETREALEQQTATAEVLQVINSSPGDLAPVFEEILDKAHTLCGAAYGGLLTYDGDAFQVAAARGDARFVEYWRQAPIRPPEGTPLWRVMRGEGLIQIIDAQAEDSYHSAPPYARLIDLGGVRTFLSLPLRKDDALLGVITAYRLEVRPFTDKQIALLQNFAAQAVIAMENARLLTETREALEQQTATAEVLQVINSSPGDLAPVFDAMLEKAMRLCEAGFGLLASFDGEAFHAAALHGVPAIFAESWREPRRPSPGLALYRLIQGEDLVHVPDVTAEDAYRSGNPIRRALADLGGARTGLWVALRKDTALLGAFVIYRQEVRPFTDKQIALLQNFAAQAVIAMENARLITETREALEQQTVTAEVLQVINSSPGDLVPVFDAILEKAHTLCGADHGTLTVADGQNFRAVATRGLPDALGELVRQPFLPAHDFHQRLLAGESFVQIGDLADARNSSDRPIDRVAIDSGVRTLLIVPLRKDGGLLGAITAFRQEVRPFSEREIALLQNFAAQVVIAMENARLLGELRQRTDEVAELNRGLEARVADQVDELGRVGRLKRFLAPQLAELIVSQGEEKILQSHRREIVVVFCDLRGYTAFTETAEPEEVLDFLREYHGALGPLVSQF